MDAIERIIILCVYNRHTLGKRASERASQSDRHANFQLTHPKKNRNLCKFIKFTQMLTMIILLDLFKNVNDINRVV